MKIWALLLYCFFFPLFATVEEDFLQANKLYMEGKLEEAKERYASIPNKGEAVWYNLGNVYYELGDIFGALAAWKAAQRRCQKELCSATTERIQYVQKEVGVHQPMGFLEWLGYQLRSVSLLLLQLLTLLWWLTFLLLCTILLFYSRTYFLWACGGLSLLFTLLCLVTVFVKYQDATTCPVLIKESTLLRIGPGALYHGIEETPAGSFATLVRRSNDWFLLKVGSKNGWVAKEKLIFIE